MKQMIQWQQLLSFSAFSSDGRAADSNSEARGFESHKALQFLSGRNVSTPPSRGGDVGSNPT